MVAAAMIFLSAPGCGSPTSPSPPYISTAQFFSGTLAALGTATFALTPTSSTLYMITLGSLTSAANDPLTSTLALTLGTQTTTDCTPLTTVNVGKSLVSQIILSVEPGTYCVKVADAGSLKDTANFSVRIVSVTGTRIAPTSVPVTETFTSNVFPASSASQSFVALTNNTVSVTLQSTGTPSVVLSVGLGVRDFSTCHITSTVKTAAGSSAQISATADAGLYCVVVADPGTLTAPTSFTLIIGHS